MARGYSAALRARAEDAASSVRTIVEVVNELGGDIRQSPGTAFGAPLGWSDADNWASVYPSLVEIMSDGSLRLKATNGTIIGPTTANAYHQAYQPLIGAPYTDPFFTSGLPVIGGGGTTFPANGTFAAVGITWQGSAVPNRYGSAQCYLNPQVSSSQPISVKTWLFRLWDAVPGTLSPIPLIAVAVENTLNAPGFVTFPFAKSPFETHYFQPMQWNTKTNQHFYLVTVSGFDGMGRSALNSGWGYDNTTQVLIIGSTLTFQGVSIGPIGVTTHVPLTLAQNLPTLQFLPASYQNSATLIFATSHPINPTGGGSPPTTDPEFVVQEDVPTTPGTALTVQASVHGAGAYQTVADGQRTNNFSSPLSSLWDIKVTLTPSTDQTATPILKAVGMRTNVAADLGDLVEVASWSERVDPLTHASEIGQCTLRVLRDGENHYRDVMTQVLASNPQGQLYFRVWVGDRSLSKNLWIYKNLFLIDDYDPTASEITIVGVSPLALLRADLPNLSADVPSYPTGDIAVGTWTGVPSGATLYPNIADIAVGGPFGNPMDSTYVQSTANPNSQNYDVTLLPISPPAQPLPNQVFIQARAALVAAGGITLQIELWEGTPGAGGAFKRALQVWNINTVDTGEGSYQPVQYSLTATEVASITNWGNLNFRVIASPGSPSTGTLRVGWARLVVTGTRTPVVYPSAANGGAGTIQTVVHDLLQAQIAVDPRYRRDAYMDPSPAIPVQKSLVPHAGGTTDLTRARREIDALMKISGYAMISSQGVIRAVAMYSTVTGFDPIWGQVTFWAAPLVGPTRAVFPPGEVVPLATSPGIRQRVPIFDVPFGYQQGVYSDTNIRASGQAQYSGEQRGINSLVLTASPAALIDTERRESDIVSQWIPTQSLANALAVRHVQTFGPGLLEWRFKSTRAHPELEIGDLVSIWVTAFVMFDPIANRALFGQQFVTGVINACWDAEGTEFSLWIQGPGGILRAVPTSGAPTYTIPTGDLVFNGGFEQGLCYWGRLPLAGTVMSLGTTAPAPLKGNASLHMHVSSSTYGVVWQKSDSTNNVADSPLAPLLLVPVRPGQVIRLAAICYDNGTNNPLTLRAVGVATLAPGQTSLASGAKPSFLLTWAGGTNAAVAQSAYYTVPAGVANIVVGCYAANLDGTEPDAYFDEVHVAFVGPGDVGSY